MVNRLVVKGTDPPIRVEAFCMVPRVAERMEGSVVGAERWLPAKLDFFNGDGLVAALGVTGCAGRAAGVVSTDLAS